MTETKKKNLIFQNLEELQQQHISECIEEQSERLDLLEKTILVEEKQKKRISELNSLQNKNKEMEASLNLLDVNGTSSSVLEQEEGHRKMLVDSMNKNSTNSNGPIVRCLTNVQGDYYL